MRFRIAVRRVITPLTIFALTIVVASPVLAQTSQAEIRGTVVIKAAQRCQGSPSPRPTSIPARLEPR